MVICLDHCVCWKGTVTLGRDCYDWGIGSVRPVSKLVVNVHILR